jgi:hypothetical protein
MKTAKNLLIASGVNALFFIWIYITQVYNITWTIAGVFHELFVIPMLLLAPVLLVLSGYYIIKKLFLKTSVVSFLISLATTVYIVWMFYKDFF